MVKERVSCKKKDFLIKKVFSKAGRVYQLRKRGISTKKMLNVFQCQISRKIKFSKVLGAPYEFLIEPTNVCNLKCPLCPTGEGTLLRPKGSMTLDDFKSIVDQISEYCISINITNYGEPLINRDLCEMIAYAKDKNIEVILGSNGHFIDQNNANKLILSGLDRIYISLDGSQKKTYVKYRIGGDYQKVVDGIKFLVKEKKRLSSQTPYIELQFIVMKHNEGEIPEIKKLAAEIGVDCLVLKTVSFNNLDWGNEKVIGTFKKFEPLNEKFRLYKTEGSSLKWKEKIENRCDFLWRGMTILCDGSIVPCCLDPQGNLKMGNVKDGILKVWNNSHYQNLRKQIIRDKSKIKLCSNCLGMN